MMMDDYDVHGHEPDDHDYDDDPGDHDGLLLNSMRRLVHSPHHTNFMALGP